MWRRAQAGEGRYHGVFYPWHLHPQRQDDWYLRNVTEAAEPRLAVASSPPHPRRPSPRPRASSSSAGA